MSGLAIAAATTRPHSMEGSARADLAPEAGGFASALSLATLVAPLLAGKTPLAPSPPGRSAGDRTTDPTPDTPATASNRGSLRLAVPAALSTAAAVAAPGRTPVNSLSPAGTVEMAVARSDSPRPAGSPLGSGDLSDATAVPDLPASRATLILNPPRHGVVVTTLERTSQPATGKDAAPDLVSRGSSPTPLTDAIPTNDVAVVAPTIPRPAPRGDASARDRGRRATDGAEPEGRTGGPRSHRTEARFETTARGGSDGGYGQGDRDRAPTTPATHRDAGATRPDAFVPTTPVTSRAMARAHDAASAGGAAATASSQPRAASIGLEPVGPSLEMVTLRIDDGHGGEARIRIAIRGDQVRATLTPTDPGLATALRLQTPDLRHALARHGFPDSAIHIGGGTGVASSPSEPEPRSSDRDPTPSDRDPQRDAQRHSSRRRQR